LISNYSDNSHSQISRNSLCYGDRHNSLSQHKSIDRIDFKNADKTQLKQKKIRPSSAVVRQSHSLSYLSSVGMSLKGAQFGNRKLSEKKINVQSRAYMNNHAQAAISQY
jgi:hypothetical protein